MYEIKAESIKTFITDKAIKLPRFQRKQTWDEKKNFQLCISLFKEYPLGVTILSVDSAKGKDVRWLLDGRQRKNALRLIYEDPENIYDWAKKFIKFSNNIQPDQLSEKIREKINEYIECDNIDDTYETYIDNDSEIIDDNSGICRVSGVEFLEYIIKLIHNKNKKGSGFTRCFDFRKYVNKLSYIDNNDGVESLSSKKVKTFIDEYLRFCEDDEIDYDEFGSFYKCIDRKFEIIEDSRKNFEVYLQKHWDMIFKRIDMVVRLDSLLIGSRIGIIEIKNLLPSDAQKIFNIINSEGEKLTAVEILSAKPSWNKVIENPSQACLDEVVTLYRRIGTVQSSVVRWDLPATFIKRLGNNFIIKNFGDSKSDFENELTMGFKILSAVFVGGVKKEDIEKLSHQNIHWSIDIDSTVEKMKNMIKLISSFNYFKFLKSWQISIMELTSDAIALDFVSIVYKDWERKGFPIGSDQSAKKFQKNCFILWDKLIYEYVCRQWRGSSDSRIANDLLNIKNEGEMFTPIDKSKWMALLEEIFTKSTIADSDITMALMIPILYHFYAMKKIACPMTEYGIEIDHIIPQALFDRSVIDRKDIIKNNILNLALLPKEENASKKDQRLDQIQDDWLKNQIIKYEFIPEDKFTMYSNVNNYEKMFSERALLISDVFDKNRDDILNN